MSSQFAVGSKVVIGERSAYAGMTGTIRSVERPRQGQNVYNVVFDKPTHPAFKSAFFMGSQIVPASRE